MVSHPEKMTHKIYSFGPLSSLNTHTQTHGRMNVCMYIYIYMYVCIYNHSLIWTLLFFFSYIDTLYIKTYGLIKLIFNDIKLYSFIVY